METLMLKVYFYQDWIHLLYFLYVSLRQFTFERHSSPSALILHGEEVYYTVDYQISFIIIIIAKKVALYKNNEKGA